MFDSFKLASFVHIVINLGYYFSMYLFINLCIYKLFINRLIRLMLIDKKCFYIVKKWKKENKKERKMKNMLNSDSEIQVSYFWVVLFIIFIMFTLDYICKKKNKL